MTAPSNLDLLRRALDRFNAGNLEEYFEIYAPDVTLHGYADHPLDLDEIREFYRADKAAFPDSTVTLLNTWALDDLVVCWFAYTATHLGELLGIPATGRTVTQEGLTVLQFRDGRCVERWSKADALALLVQIGAYQPR